ncbi:MAG: helix-turn-helix domain-containing protein [Bacteroidota bacterium]|nr:helix-turn-helix domain-containing protein [Bacteroidota bacterium]
MPSHELTSNSIGVAQNIEEILTPETGNILRKAREARGLTVAEVAARLRLNPHFIENMESGDLRPLPPGPYRKAFVSEYAKFLNIKLETLLGPAGAERSEGIISSAVSAMPGVAKKVTQRAVKTTGSVVKKVEEGVKDAVEEITARDLWEEADEVRKERLGITIRNEETPPLSMRRRDEPPSFDRSTERESGIEELPPPKEIRRARRLEEEQNARKEAAPVYEPDEVEEETHAGMSRATKTIVGLLVVIAAIVGYSVLTKKSTQPANPEPKQETAVKAPEPKPKPVAPPKKDSTAVVAALNDSLIFSMTAKDSVWVSVSPDVGQGFRGKLAKGEVRRFSAKEKYVLYLGNQKSVSMTLDGKPISNLPTVPGSSLVVRNVILTRGKISAAPAEPAPAKKPELHHESHTMKKGTKNPLIHKQIPQAKPVLPR